MSTNRSAGTTSGGLSPDEAKRWQDLLDHAKTGAPPNARPASAKPPGAKNKPPTPEPKKPANDWLNNPAIYGGNKRDEPGLR